MKYDVWVLLREGDKNMYTFVNTMSGDIGEIVTALQVLFPDMIGVQIEPEGSDADSSD